VQIQEVKVPVGDEELDEERVVRWGIKRPPGSEAQAVLSTIGIQVKGLAH
jgi:hypothetical protein